ncbi:phosphoribosyltransferase [Candidatus Ferrigenium straubiae]|jgi:predicted phosphoribosyltransferase|uniref:phosphoribosyltransferase n=1 Tax=Candidatus Ferrigenium straubiae TaxID=2919506 RepID=UPI003F4ABA7D
MLFRDRDDAARRLAEALAQYRGQNPLVLAIPRGAVPMAKIIAEELSGEVDVVLVRKLRAPGNPEFAIGAVDETGWVYLAEHGRHVAGSQEYIDSEKAAQMEVMRERRASYTPVRPPHDPAERIVIVVDDGLATGSTMIAALHALRARQPQKLVCAVPVAPPDTLDKVSPYADEIVCLSAPELFYAVGQFYQSFPQVSDEEVIAALAGD